MHVKFRLNRQLKKGYGQPIVFIHGLGSSGRYWSPVFKHIPADYKVSAYDLLGFGESPKPEPFSYSAANQAKALRKSLRRDYPFRKVTLVGHSMGGLVALEFAKRYPGKVKRLFLTNVPILFSSGDYHEVKRRYTEVGDRMRNHLHQKTYEGLHNSKFIKEKLLPRYARYKLNQPEFDPYDYTHISPYAYESSIKYILAQPLSLRGLRSLWMPVVIINTNKDRAVIAGNSEKFAAKIPLCKLLQVEGTHQFPHMQPKEFWQILNRYS